MGLVGIRYISPLFGISAKGEEYCQKLVDTCNVYLAQGAEKNEQNPLALVDLSQPLDFSELAKISDLGQNNLAYYFDVINCGLFLDKSGKTLVPASKQENLASARKMLVRRGQKNT